MEGGIRASENYSRKTFLDGRLRETNASRGRVGTSAIIGGNAHEPELPYAQRTLERAMFLGSGTPSVQKRRLLVKWMVT